MVSRHSPSVPLVSPRFQVLLMVCTTVILAFLIVKRTQLFQPSDRVPNIEIYTPQALNALGGLIEYINIGLYIENFNKFDTVNNEFIADCVLWFTVTPGTTSLETLGKFSLKRGTIINRSAPMVKMADGKLLVQYKIRVSFSTELDFSSFPTDDHYISLQFTNDFISPNEALFQTNQQDLIVDKNIYIYGWDFVGKDALAGYLATDLDPGDLQKKSTIISAVFTLFYSSVGLRFTISVFLPLIMILFISLFCFSFSDIGRTTGIAVSIVTALITYRFVIDGISPHVGYFMISDYLFFYVLAATFIIFFMMVLDSFGAQTTLMSKKIVIIILHCALLAMITYFLFGR